MKDVTGKTLQIGNRVYFPVRESSSCFLAEGAITGFNFKFVLIRSFATNAINYRRAKDVVKVPAKTKTVTLTNAKKRYLGIND